MASLQNSRTGDRVSLTSHHLVGRARLCLLRIPEREVSGQHASFHWNGSAWELRDLGSRNGTFIDDQRVLAGEPTIVIGGARVRFGPCSEWVLLDDSAPQAMAATDDGATWVLAEDGVLALPEGAECPEVSIYRATSGGWRAERGDGVDNVADHDSVVIGDRVWRLYLPDTSLTTITTADAAEARPTLNTIELEFSVSSDEEYVVLAVLHGERRFDLESRAHHYPLLVLARARLRDEADPAVPPGAAGWVYQDDLITMLGSSRTRLNIDIHRARKQLGALGIADPADIVERRPSTRQLRIGVAELRIVTI